MQHPYLSKMLRDGEEVIALIRRTALAIAGRIIVSLILLCAPFFFLFPLFHYGKLGILAFFLLLGMGIVLGIRTVLLYYFNTLVITSHRIIDMDQRGMFNRTVSDAAYSRIQDVSFTIKGIAQTIFHYGSLTIETAGSSSRLLIQGVRNPERVHDLIMRMIAQQNDGEGEDDSFEGDLDENNTL